MKNEQQYFYYTWHVGATVSLNKSQYSVQESDNFSGNITLSRAAVKNVIVEVTITSGSAYGNVEQLLPIKLMIFVLYIAGTDYTSTALKFNITIFAGSKSSSFSVDIIDDMIQEGNETFNITIRLLPSCLLLSLGTLSSTVMIIDNDGNNDNVLILWCILLVSYLTLVAVIEFASSEFSGRESSKVISASIIILDGIISSKDIDVMIKFMPETAQG